MSITRLTIATFALLIAAGAHAQQKNNGRISWWPAYYLRHSINKRWMLNTDVQARNFAKQPLFGLFAMRVGAHYRINDQWSVAAGTAWFHQQQLDATKKKAVTDELRLWEELRHDWKINRWQITNQFRTEQRHWINQDGIALRLRYKLAAEVSLYEKWKVLAGNELMWQGSKTRSNWDQYRLWIGGEYAFNTNNQVQLLLMNWWQFNNDIKQPVFRISFVQSIKSGL